MKLKEVCEKTGLTQKTIRFYEERGLIAPSHSTKNGRSYRHYSDRDVVILNEIATLRKALFTLDEIATIQKDPSSTFDIFTGYKERIINLASTLKDLEQTVQHMELPSETNMSQLAQMLDHPTKTLTLPAYDTNPHFRHLEEMELERLKKQHANLDARQGDSPFLLSIQQFTTRKQLFSECMEYNSSLNGGSANYPEKGAVRLMRIVHFILSAVITGATLAIFVFLLTRKQSYTETWNHIRCWLIPLDLIAIILRLTVSSFQANVSAIRSHIRPNKDSVIKSGIAALLIILSILGGTCLASSPVPAEETEYTLVICSEQSFDRSLLEDFQHMLTETVMEDASDRQATITTLSLQNSDDLMTLKKQLSTDAWSLYLFDQTDYQIFIEKVAVPSELEFVPQDLSDAPFVTQFGVEDLPFWGCVIDTGNSTDAAVMLEKLQTAHFAFWYPR